MLLRPRVWRSLALTLLIPLFLLGGCASTHPRDPFEPMNRVIYRFNDGVDTVLFRPIAEGYRTVLPQFARTGISNFFSNINDVLVALNSLLQGKVINAASDVGRVLVNSTIGIGGLFDVATRFGLEKHNEDFGQTLGYWGMADGPYLVLPIIGPSNFRDTLGRVVDAKSDPIGYLESVRWRNSLWGTRFVNQRAELLDTSKLLDTASLDPYEFLRDAYLQRRRNLIYDGAPPREKDDDDSDKPNLKPQTSSPFPSSAEADSMLPGTPWVNAEDAAPGPTRTTHDAIPAPVVKQPSAQAAPPTGEVATGKAAIEVQQRVVRVWTPPAD